MGNIANSPVEIKAPTSALDSEAIAEAEEIKEENAKVINDAAAAAATLGHVAQKGEMEAWDLAGRKCKEELLQGQAKDVGAMEAESERAAQIKRALEVEMESMVDEDLFSIQEQYDIQAALELSRADQNSQEGAAPCAKNRRLSEDPAL